MDYLEKIDNALDRKLMNHADLARLTGFSPSRISKWFGGEGKPNLYQASRIAKALDIPLDYLADDDQVEPPIDMVTPQRRRIWDLVQLMGDDEAIRRLAKVDVPPAAGVTVASTPVKHTADVGDRTGSKRRSS